MYFRKKGESEVKKKRQSIGGITNFVGRAKAKRSAPRKNAYGSTVNNYRSNEIILPA